MFFTKHPPKPQVVRDKCGGVGVGGGGSCFIKHFVFLFVWVSSGFLLAFVSHTLSFLVFEGFVNVFYIVLVYV